MGFPTALRRTSQVRPAALLPAAQRVSAPDVALAVGVGLVVLVDGLLGPGPGLGVLDCLLIAAMTGAVALRQRWPRATLGVIAVLVLAYLIHVAPGPAGSVPLLIALYTTVRAGHGVMA